MYYGKGNYEAFYVPRKTEGIEDRKAYIVGTGLGGLAAACFLIRDAQMPGENITLYEALDMAGGSCDGHYDPKKGYIMRGGREMDDHFECMYDLFRSIPSIVDPNTNVLQELGEINKDDPNFSNCRVTEKRGQDAHTDKKYALSAKGGLEILKLMMLPERALQDVTIGEFFTDAMFNSNFWVYFETMFAFNTWHSALEMRRYLWRYIHHIDGLPDLSALRFTKYNQFTQWILPMCNYIQDAGGKIVFDTVVTHIELKVNGKEKVATKLVYETGGKEESVDIKENDIVVITNGAQGDGSVYGDMETSCAEVCNNDFGDGSNANSVKLWRDMCSQVSDGSLGNPDKFFVKDVKKTSWESWSLQTSNVQILDRIREITKRDPLSGKVVTGGIVTCRDSGWLMSWTINRQGQFMDQPKDSAILWCYALYNWDRNGDFVKKPVYQCTGYELTEETLYHIGLPVDEIPELAKECRTTPCMMPYVTTFFMPRQISDRPKVVPDGAKNFGFVGEFVETPRDTNFTTEIAIRTGMELVYTLVDMDRAVPEVWGSPYDVREMFRATGFLMDHKTTLEFMAPKAVPVLETVGKVCGPVVKGVSGVVKSFLPKKESKVTTNVFKENVLFDLLKQYGLI